MNRDAKLLALADGLLGHGERRENQHGLACVRDDMARPFDLLCGFAESAILEQCRASSAQRPFDNMPLPVKQARRKCRVVNFKADSRDVLAL